VCDDGAYTPVWELLSCSLVEVLPSDTHSQHAGEKIVDGVIATTWGPLIPCEDAAAECDAGEPSTPPNVADLGCILTAVYVCWGRQDDQAGYTTCAAAKASCEANPWICNNVLIIEYFAAAAPPDPADFNEEECRTAEGCYEMDVGMYGYRQQRVELYGSGYCPGFEQIPEACS
jgi:hypothetical protein